MYWARVVELKRKAYINPALLKEKEVKEELRRDAIRTWATVSLYLGNESFITVLEMLEQAVPEKKALIREAKEGLRKLNFAMSNI